MNERSQFLERFTWTMEFAIKKWNRSSTHVLVEVSGSGGKYRLNIEWYQKYCKNSNSENTKNNETRELLEKIKLTFKKTKIFKMLRIDF